jgi:hypothetical protein
MLEDCDRGDQELNTFRAVDEDPKQSLVTGGLSRKSSEDGHSERVEVIGTPAGVDQAKKTGETSVEEGFDDNGEIRAIWPRIASPTDHAAESVSLCSRYSSALCTSLPHTFGNESCPRQIMFSSRGEISAKRTDCDSFNKLNATAAISQCPVESSRRFSSVGVRSKRFAQPENRVILHEGLIAAVTIY